MPGHCALQEGKYWARDYCSSAQSSTARQPSAPVGICMSPAEPALVGASAAVIGSNLREMFSSVGWKDGAHMEVLLAMGDGRLPSAPACLKAAALGSE